MRYRMSVTKSTADFATFSYFLKNTEAILTRLNKQVFSLLLVAGMFAPAAFAGSKDNPHDMLMKSFQQGSLWTQGPVKLAAKVSLLKAKPDGSSVDLDYTLSWAGPEKWRSEWTANGFDQVYVLNNNKLSYFSSLPKPLVRLFQLEMAIAVLDAANPAGPYTIPPLDWEKAKPDVTKKKVNNIDAKCVAVGDPQETICIDPATGHVLSVTITVPGAEVSSFEYSDYATSGTTSYPQSVKVYYAKELLNEAKLTVTRDDKFADTLFAPPDKSTTVDFLSCADVAKNFTAPHVTKSVPAKEPDAAVKAKKFGLVWVLANVGKDGSVTKADVIGGDPDLVTVATAAVQQYKYTPYMRCGQAVQFQVVVVVPFAPPQTKKPQDDIIG